MAAGVAMVIDGAGAAAAAVVVVVVVVEEGGYTLVDASMTSP